MNTEKRTIECCGRALWSEVVIEHDNGEIETYLILPNEMLAIEFHGACMICHQEWHWSPPEVRLRKILARQGRLP